MEPRNGKMPGTSNIWRGKGIKVFTVRDGCLTRPTAFDREWSPTSWSREAGPDL